MKTYIIAEIGPNHNGNLNRAISMVEELAKVGVDAVKFQLTIPANIYSKDAFKPSYQKENDHTASPLEMSKRYQLSFSDHLKLAEVCKENKVDYLCTGFDLESLKFLNDNIEMPYFKIPSGEILSTDLLEYIGNKNRKILLSTGMASYKEIETAIKILGNKDRITVFHCISNYPAPAVEVNLNVMNEIKSRFGVSIGFSDHTIGNDAAIAAVALGAEVIEKHVTFDKDAEGPDHKASSTIPEFASLVNSIRNIDLMMGSSEKIFSDKELEIKKAARKSIVSARDLLAGEKIEREDVCFKRPGFGFSPIQLDEILGKTLTKDIGVDRVIMKEHLL